MLRIGVRELRQHASRYLQQVAAGERIEVTDRGRPVALLVPVGGSDAWEQAVLAGRVRRPTRDLLADAPVNYGIAASEELERMRLEER